MYVNESEIGAEIMDEHFYSLTEVPNDYYEVVKTKKKINLDLLIHLTVFILNYAKLRMLEFYYDFWTITFIVKTLRSSKMILTATTLGSLEDLIKPELREEFEQNKHNWFVTPLALQGKHTPGLFKVEFKGDKMIGLYSKSYCTELFASENSPAQVNYSTKGVNKVPHATLRTRLHRKTKF